MYKLLELKVFEEKYVYILLDILLRVLLNLEEKFTSN